jgi:hypothetical protein
MQWVKENVKDREKILTLRIMPTLFYRDKYKIEKNKIVHYWYELEDVSTPEKLRKFVNKNGITYIMFPYSPEYPYSQHVPILQYLKENNENEFLLTSKFQRDKYSLHIYRTR